MKRLTCLCLLLVLLPMAGRSGEGLKGLADKVWAGRDDPQNAMLALEYYEQIAVKNPKDPGAVVDFARAAYWAIDEMKLDMSKSRKVEVYEKAIKLCKDVVDKDPDNMDAWLYIIYDMGGLTLVKGILLGGWGLRDAVVGTIMVSRLDVTLNYGGIYRYWGSVIFNTPGVLKKFFHFSDEDSLWLYDKSVAIEPGFLKTYILKADTYKKMGRKDKAKQMYQFVIDQPENILPDLVAENRVYKRQAEELLADM